MPDEESSNEVAGDEPTAGDSVHGSVEARPIEAQRSSADSTEAIVNWAFTSHLTDPGTGWIGVDQLAPANAVPRVLPRLESREIAALAKLSLSPVEVAQFDRELNRILAVFETLESVDVDGVQATVHPVADRNLWREDQVQPSLTREEALANAPESEHGFFKVPPVIE